ncbi:MAG: sigma-70 family RNA polymerase sigma factor [Planctomycetota bacterium]
MGARDRRRAEGAELEPRAAADGADGAIEALLRDHGPFLQRLARGLVHDEHAAEDLVHDTWVAALRRPSTTLRDMRGWLAAVLRRRAVSEHRRSYRSREVRAEHEELAPGLTHDVQGSDTLERLERGRLLHEAVARLAEPNRTAVVLRYHDGLTPTQIAAQTGAPVKTVKTRLTRGLSQLRADLARHSGGAVDDSDPRAWLSVVAPLLGDAPGPIPTSPASPPTRPPHLPGLPCLPWAPLASIAVKKSLIPLACVLVAALALMGVRAMRLRNAPRPAPLTAELVLPPPVVLVARAPALEGTPASSRADGALDPDAATEQTVTRASSNTAVLRVRVLSDAGAPVPNRLLQVEGPFDGGARLDPVQLRADVEGELELADLAPGGYRVQDALGVAQAVTKLEAGASETLELRLEDDRAAIVHVVVAHADGRPAAGATVYGGSRYGRSAYVRPLARADAAGRCELQLGLALELQAALAGYLPSEMFDVGGLPEERAGVREARLVLGGAGARLSGRVVDVDGAPVVGARVVAGHRGGWTSGDMRGLAPHPVTIETDVDGRFEYGAGLPPGRSPVVAHAPGWATTTMFVDAPAGPSPAPLTIELVLRRGSRLTGFVRGPDGAPAVGAIVSLEERTPAGEPQLPGRPIAACPSATSDAEGAYTLDLVPQGEHVVSAESAWSAPRALAKVPVIVPEGTAALDLTLSDEPAIGGRVIDHDGLPIVGVQIELTDALGNAYPRSLLTDDAGRFRATCLPAPQGFRLGSKLRKGDGRVLIIGEWTVTARTVSAQGIRVLGSVEGVRPGTLDVELTAVRPEPASAFLTGRVVWPGGRVPADARLTAWRTGTNAGVFVDVEAESGRFRHGPLQPGSYRLELTRQDEGIASRSGLVLGAGETLDAGDLGAGAGGGLVVTERLTGFEAVPAAATERLLREARVRLTRAGQRERWLVRTETGWRSEDALEPGGWRLMGDAEGVEFDAVEVTITAGPATPLEWTVRFTGR